MYSSQKDEDEFKLRLIGGDQRSSEFFSFYNFLFCFRLFFLIYTQGVFEGKRAGVVAGIGNEGSAVSSVQDFVM